MQGKIAAAVAAFALAACATEPVELAKSPSAQAEPAFAAASPARAHLVVARDVGANSAFHVIEVTVDGRRAARLQPGEHVLLALQPGERDLAAMPADVPSMGYKPTAVEVNARAGERRVYRVGFDADGRVTLLRDRTSE